MNKHPKFIHYTANADTLATFLEGLSFHDMNIRGSSFPPSSSLLFEYYQGCGEDQDQKDNQIAADD